MNFINPLFLFGLISAAIPLLLHLLNLKKQKNIEFSTLKFLKELQKTKVRKVKIKQIILLILRTLIIIFIVLAFSRPTIESNIPGFSSYSNTSAIILLDNSFSLKVSDEFGDRLRQTQLVANKILDEMHQSDEVIILPISDLDRLSSYSWQKVSPDLKEDILKIRPGKQPAKLIDGFKYAANLFNEANNLNKLIYIISDNQENIIDLSDTTNLSLENIGILSVKIGRNSEYKIRNISIDSVNFISTILQKNMPIELEVFLNNHSDRQVENNLMQMELNGEKITQLNYSLSPNEKSSFIISGLLKGDGVYDGLITIENDALLIDNNYYFSFIVQPEPNVIVYGNNDNSLLNIVLENAREAGLLKSLVYTDNLKNISNNDNQILFFSKKDINIQDITQIKQLISKGINLVLFPSESEDEQFLKLLDEIGFGVSKIEKNENVSQFQNVEMLHPLFQGVFTGTTSNKKIESPDIFKTLLVRQGRSIISMVNGIFLSELKTSNSNILYFAVPPNNKWSNIGVSSLFPAIITRSVAYLNDADNIQSNDEKLDDKLLIDKKNILNADLSLEYPNGDVINLESIPLKEKILVTLPQINTFGNYTVNNSGVAVSVFSNNHSSSESSLEYYEDEKLVEDLEKFGIDKNNVDFVIDDKNIKESIQRAKLGTELWQLALLLALICALLEMIVQKVSKNEE